VLPYFIAILEKTRIFCDTNQLLFNVPSITSYTEGPTMKIGNISFKKEPKYKVSSILAKAALGVFALIVISNIPDVKRYIQISMM